MDEVSCLMASVGEHTFAIPLDWIHGIVQTPEVVPIPGADEHVRGTVQMLDVWLSLIDLRTVCGLPSADAERHLLVEQLMERRAEHQRWLDQLAEAADNSTQFGGEVDPTRCAFGRWHAVFEPPNPRIAMLFKQFGHAHEAIHAVAVDVTTLQQAGDHEGARKRVDQAKKNELARLLTLFERTFVMVGEANREVTVSVCVNGRKIAIAVDTVHRVEVVKLIDRLMDQQLVRYGDGKHAIMLDLDQLLAQVPA